MKLFLNAILILAITFACYIEDIYLNFRPPQAGQVIPLTLRSEHYFDFDQEKALGDRREMALSHYTPIYAYVPFRAEEAKREVEILVERISAFRDPELSGVKNLMEFIRLEYGVQLDTEAAERLLLYPELENLAAGILTIQESVLQRKIVEDLTFLKGKEKIDILYPKPAGIVTYPTGDIISLNEARLMIRAKADQLLWQVDKRVLSSVLEISLVNLRPNLEYDRIENDRRIENIIEKYPSEVIAYKPGDVLVPFQKVLDEEDILLLAAYRDLTGNVPWTLMAILFIVVLNDRFLVNVLSAGWRKDPPFGLLLLLLILTVCLCKACLLFTVFPVFLVPFGVLPLLIILLYNERIIATWTTIIGAMLVSLFTNCTWNVLVFFIFGGLIAVLTSSRIHRRIHVLRTSVAIGISNAVIFTFFSMDWATWESFMAGLQKAGVLATTEIIGNNLLANTGLAFMGGFAAGPIALVLLPLLETVWHTASAFKLNRYADLKHPLMKDLLTKTPATYQHSMTVAYLAEAVGQNVGADQTLLRIGAYFHDIGKMGNPKFFAENQFGGENPHDNLDPRESAKIIIDHVSNGEKIGRELRLPEVVLDLIRQHHGTQAVEYFYTKARKEGECQKKDFCYPGPKPQTIEAAILMIVDAVEATTRSLHKPSRAKIAKVIRFLVIKRLADGQFDECNLSTRYLTRIVQTLVDSVEASFHSRVAYPWQEKEKGGETGQ